MAGAPVEVLQGVPLFADLSKREVRQIARLFKQRRFAEGETIAKEGAGGGAFFLIDSGEAKVTVGGKERRTLGAGEYFGEIALIDEGTFWDFRPLVQENAMLGWKLLQAMAKMVRAEQEG
jgi:CRP/FNR family cyclic AMP-dependent transcriptional regulator